MRFFRVRRLSELRTAEPPVVFIRVVQPVIEAPIRRGLALSHVPMLTLTRTSGLIHAPSPALPRTELAMYQEDWMSSVGASRYFGRRVVTFAPQAAQ
jgi:hypothetical protein